MCEARGRSKANRRHVNWLFSTHTAVLLNGCWKGWKLPLNQSSYKDKLIKKKIILSLSCLPVISRPPVLICLWHQSQGVNSFVNCFSKGGILLHFPTFVLFMTNNKIITICFRITIKDERLLTYYCKQKKRLFKRLDFCCPSVRPLSAAPNRKKGLRYQTNGIRDFSLHQHR